MTCLLYTCAIITATIDMTCLFYTCAIITATRDMTCLLYTIACNKYSGHDMFPVSYC